MAKSTRVTKAELLSRAQMAEHALELVRVELSDLRTERDEWRAQQASLVDMKGTLERLFSITNKLLAKSIDDPVTRRDQQLLMLNKLFDEAMPPEAPGRCYRSGDGALNAEAVSDAERREGYGGSLATHRRGEEAARIEHAALAATRRRKEHEAAKPVGPYGG